MAHQNTSMPAENGHRRLECGHYRFVLPAPCLFNTQLKKQLKQWLTCETECEHLGLSGSGTWKPYAALVQCIPLPYLQTEYSLWSRKKILLPAESGDHFVLTAH